MKDQLILKAIYDVLDSPKKLTKKIDLRYHSAVFCFWGESSYHKLLSRLLIFTDSQ